MNITRDQNTAPRKSGLSTSYSKLNRACPFQNYYELQKYKMQYRVRRNICDLEAKP